MPSLASSLGLSAPRLFGGDSTPGGASDAWLMEGAASGWLMEDGASFWLLET